MAYRRLKTVGRPASTVGHGELSKGESLRSKREEGSKLKSSKPTPSSSVPRPTLAHAVLPAPGLLVGFRAPVCSTSSYPCTRCLPRSASTSRDTRPQTRPSSATGQANKCDRHFPTASEGSTASQPRRRHDKRPAKRQPRRGLSCLVRIKYELGYVRIFLKAPPKSYLVSNATSAFTFSPFHPYSWARTVGIDVIDFHQRPIHLFDGTVAPQLREASGAKSRVTVQMKRSQENLFAAVIPLFPASFRSSLDRTSPQCCED